MTGKVKAALQYLADNQNAGLVSLDEMVSENVTVREILKEKHPSPKEVHADALLSKSSTVTNPTHPVIFESIDGISNYGFGRPLRGGRGRLEAIADKLQ